MIISKEVGATPAYVFCLHSDEPGSVPLYLSSLPEGADYNLGDLLTSSLRNALYIRPGYLHNYFLSRGFPELDHLLAPVLVYPPYGDHYGIITNGSSSHTLYLAEIWPKTSTEDPFLFSPSPYDALVMRFCDIPSALLTLSTYYKGDFDVLEVLADA